MEKYEEEEGRTMIEDMEEIEDMTIYYYNTLDDFLYNILFLLWCNLLSYIFLLLYSIDDQYSNCSNDTWKEGRKGLEGRMDNGHT